MTIYYILIALFMAVVVFGITYKIKGLKTALVTTGVVFIGFLGLYLGMIYLIVNSMD
jgi:hypothetical protein